MPISRDVLYVYITTRVVPAIVRSNYACSVMHTCSGRARTVVSNCGASFLLCTVPARARPQVLYWDRCQRRPSEGLRPRLCGH